MSAGDSAASLSMFAHSSIWLFLGVASLAAMSMPLDGGRGLTAPVTIDVRASDYAFIAPDTIDPGVVTLRLLNAGPGVHQMVIYRLDAVADLAVVSRTLLENRARPANVVKVGGLEGIEARKSDSVTLALSPGRYVLACGLPAPDGKAHVTKGMLRPLVVRDAPRGGAISYRLPAADVTVQLSEYTFTLAKPILAGRTRLRVENVGKQAHHLLLARLRPGVTLADVDRWDGRGKPPFDDMGGVGALDPGQANDWTIDLAPGTYMLSCVLADAVDKRPHYMHGMERAIRVR